MKFGQFWKLFIEKTLSYFFFLKMLFHLVNKLTGIFIRPSLDGTYYGMALSVCPSVASSTNPCGRDIS